SGLDLAGVAIGRSEVQLAAFGADGAAVIDLIGDLSGALDGAAIGNRPASEQGARSKQADYAAVAGGVDDVKRAGGGNFDRAGEVVHAAEHQRRRAVGDDDPAGTVIDIAAEVSGSLEHAAVGVEHATGNRPACE